MTARIRKVIAPVAEPAVITALGPAGQPPRPCPRWPLSARLPAMGALRTAPATARAHVRAVLAAWDMDGTAEAAQLVTSELVTNSVLASSDEDGRPAYVNGRVPCLRVGLCSDRRVLRIEVWDEMPEMPRARSAGSDDESGRGLVIVDGLASEWGAYPWPGGGKVVYAVLDAR